MLSARLIVELLLSCMIFIVSHEWANHDQKGKKRRAKVEDRKIAAADLVEKFGRSSP